MIRSILAVIAGYAVMAAFVFLSFTLAYLAMGTERAFRPGVYDVTFFWIAVSFTLSLVAALLGGFVCAAIARGPRAPRWLAVLVLALGLVLAIPTFMAPSAGPSEARTGAVGNFAAMQSARQPDWVTAVTPILGAIGVLAGAGRRRRKATPAA